MDRAASLEAELPHLRRYARALVGEGDFGYALIGDLARDPLLRAARAVYSEFRALPAAD